MDKWQAIDEFWHSFGWAAYDQYSVPDDAGFPRITYEVATDSYNQTVPLTASLWTRESSWEIISKKADEIARAITDGGYYINKIDGGYLWITKGSVFAQRMNDPNDDMIKRIYLSITAEFLTGN